MAGYQVMPRLSPDEYESLEQDIVENGVQVPIIVAPDGTIIDGHHRDEIARKHDLHCPRRTVEGDTSKLRSMAYSLNLHRRHLNREQKRELIAQSLKSDPGMNDYQHSKRTGASPHTVKAVRESLPDLQNANEGTRVNARGQERPPSYERSAPKPRLIPVPDPEPDPTPRVEEEPEDDTPEWEEVAQIPPARLKDVSRPTAVNIPQEDLDELNNAPGKPPSDIPAPKIHKPLDEDYFDRKDHMVKMLQEARKAEKALKELLYLAQHIDSWSQGSLTDSFRDLLDEIDQTLNSGGMDAALARLIEGENQ